ncbi:hypothetical protein PC116_g13412 [Phytophthora cactorum]|uniref:Uncharacterized protein n=1 Tax=Phytophthora cactorum TaxID=29920 RepID=A0A8T1KP66_9STRA|nr:hypothetical protein Pcac1_g18821 [Phytophthora cactorum]KAG2890650.1 hypothetical protein PC114_g17362 [Phytophthora cactorum]KAG2939124.1 hypothetical protein PC117_g11040 [Phytophthora cactorum]KAG2958294.1 hypothetical protein PC119_g27061 [Phytophthora cactorum]KAG3139778.1 hypothetical protein C6341_g20244 [Phytophthora cactorum]
MFNGEDGRMYLRLLTFPRMSWDESLKRPVDGSVQASLCHRGSRGEIRCVKTGTSVVASIATGAVVL